MSTFVKLADTRTGGQGGFQGAGIGFKTDFVLFKDSLYTKF